MRQGRPEPEFQQRKQMHSNLQPAKEYRFKRLFDLCIGVPALIVVSPIMLMVSFLVAVFLGTPLLFRQPRPGLHGKVFTLFKFRTMTDKVNADGELLPDQERITPFGRFLRSTSLDELPELIHVICGDMSIVGPRPLLVRYLERYSPAQMTRHLVRPGITGWSQVNGRNSISWSQKFANDVWYVEHQSLWLDLKIIFMTIAWIAKRDGINQGRVIGAPEFMGNGPMETSMADDASHTDSVLKRPS